MTARLFSRLEPIANPADPARAIAAFFFVVAGVGAAPAIYGLICMTFMALASFAELEPAGVLGSFAMIFFIILGIAQARFYFRRAVGSDTPGARGWWLSTYVYNLIPLGLSIAATWADPEILFVVSSLWFAVLSTLALIAHGSEPRRAPEAVDRGQRLIR